MLLFKSDKGVAIENERDTMSMFKCPRAELHISNKEQKKLEKTGHCEVTYPVSIRYNGGMTLNEKGEMLYSAKQKGQFKWYEGYSVPRPKVLKGYELVNIGVGYQLNAHPPYATMVLRKKV